ncbi:helix-turn-helix domain-containing protein [Streptomyces californicus]|uniref:helix-turn-helix domain-containing protein n=1 Tax=Streptomyces californicus TaxID=67351 RepID=UPI00296F9E45|nr:helix-turn-helix domain-containing protein [Streptomyces californicus]MDW4903454.1 helix-turn-helix domain-containing protein [Streptomyces californicus]
MSTRTFDRRFRELASTSPTTGRTRARLLVSLPLLTTESMTSVADRLSYASPAAFTAALLHTFGTPSFRLG